MDEIESKLSSILGNPQMMQQIMAMAQSMGQDEPKPEQKPEPQKATAPPAMPDTAMLQRIAGIARQSGVDKNQLALLKALSPYLTRERISKLERAMRAAKIAAAASAVLGGNLPFLSGR